MIPCTEFLDQLLALVSFQFYDQYIYWLYLIFKVHHVKYHSIIGFVSVGFQLESKTFLQKNNNTSYLVYKILSTGFVKYYFLLLHLLK